MAASRMLEGKMEFPLGSEQRVCGPGDVVVIPGGAEHEAWFREDKLAPGRLRRFFDLKSNIQVL
jgi:quercetin dioxygenase-like cupin family protein